MTPRSSDDTQRPAQDEVPISAADAERSRLARADARPRRRRWPRAVLFGVLVLAAVALSHPWWLARVLSSRLSAESGREVRIGRLTLGLAPGGPRATLRDVRIGNAPWAGTATPMADLREVVFDFDWATLLAERKDIARLALFDGRVDLRRLADGRRNWRLRNPDDTGPGRYRVLALEPHRLALGFEHRGVDLALAAVATDLPPGAASALSAGTPTPMPAITTHIAIEGTWRDVPMAWSLDTGPLLTFVDTRATFPLRGTAEIGGVALAIDGLAGDLFREPAFDAGVELSGRSLASLAPLIGGRWPADRTFRATGRLRAKEGRYTLAGASATVGRTDLAGDVAWQRGDDAPALEVALRSRRADWADLAWLLGRTAPAAGRAAQQAKTDARVSKRGGSMSPQATRVPPPSALPAQAAVSAGTTLPSGAASAAAAALEKPSTRDRLARWRATLRYDAAAFHVDAVPELQSVAVQATLADGTLAVPAFDVGISGGRVHGSASAALAEATPRAKVELQASGFRLERLLARGGDARRAVPAKATGALSGRATLEATGADRDALLDSLRGHVSVDVREGAISGLLDAQLGLSPGRIVRRMVGGDAPVALRCVHAGLDVAGGTARIASLVVASETTRTTGRGSVDLGDRTLDVTLTPEPVGGGGGWFDLDRSIRLTGPLAKPAKALVARVPIRAAGC